MSNNQGSVSYPSFDTSSSYAQNNNTYPSYQSNYQQQPSYPSNFNQSYSSQSNNNYVNPNHDTYNNYNPNLNSGFPPYQPNAPSDQFQPAYQSNTPQYPASNQYPPSQPSFNPNYGPAPNQYWPSNAPIIQSSNTNYVPTHQNPSYGIDSSIPSVSNSVSYPAPIATSSGGQIYPSLNTISISKPADPYLSNNLSNNSSNYINVCL
jgi:hypothetical protein